MVLSKFPLNPLSTVKVRFSSENPISRSFCTFHCKSSAWDSPTEFPNTLEGLLYTIGGDGDRAASRASASALASAFFFLDDMGNIEDADLKPNLLLLVFGGSEGEGRRSSDSVLPVLPVSCRLCSGWTRAPCVFLFIYFSLIYLSIAGSTSSTSRGTFGFEFVGLYMPFDAAFPVCFMN